MEKCKSGSKRGWFDVNISSEADSNNEHIKGTRYILKNECPKALTSDNNMPEKPEKLPRADSKCVEIRLYKRRFLMLLLFALCSMMNAFPQFGYTVVADIVSCHYDVGVSDVNWTSVIYMVLFIPFVFPVMLLMSRKGIKITLVMGGVMNALGSWLQCFSYTPDRFLVVMVSQTFYSLGQVFVLSLPPFIAGVWFGAEEVGLACALGVFGNQLGVAIGFIVPPIVLTNNCTDQLDISYELSIIAYSTAAINTLLLIVIILVFQEGPPLWPSIAQASKLKENTDYARSLKSLFTDKPFILLLLGYGLLTGAYFAMSTIMNEMVLIHFPGKEADVGLLGAIMVFAGMVGSIVLGALLDRTHRFKSISFITFILSFLLLAGYTVVIEFLPHLWIQYLFFTLLGLIMTGYLPAGFDFGAEITYPVPEAMSGSLLNTSTQVFSIILTNSASLLLQSFGDFSSNILLAVSVFVGTIIIGCIKCELKRTNAGKICEDNKEEKRP